MPFISRSKLEALRENEKTAIEEMGKNLDLQIEIASLEDRVEQIDGFLKYLAQNVPDYEDYIIEYMELEEFGDDKS